MHQKKRQKMAVVSCCSGRLHLLVAEVFLKKMWLLYLLFLAVEAIEVSVGPQGPQARPRRAENDWAVHQETTRKPHTGDMP